MAKGEKNRKIKERSQRTKMTRYDQQQNIVDIGVDENSKSKIREISSAVRAMFKEMYTADDPEQE